MKTIIKKLAIYSNVLLLSTFISCSKDEIEISPEDNIELSQSNATAQTVTVTLINGEEIGPALIRAIRQAGSGGTVVIPDGTYPVSNDILLPNDVPNIRIQGSGRNNVRLEATGQLGNGGVIVTGANNTTYSGFTVDRKNFNQRNAAAVSTNGKLNVHAFGMRFANASYGFGTPNNGTFGTQGTGLPITGLIASGSEFANCERGIAFNRSFSSRPNSAISRMPNIRISDCAFFGNNMLVAVTMDAGNDGADGTTSNRNLPRAVEAMQTVTDMENMLIERNFFGPAVFGSTRKVVELGKILEFC